MRVVQPGSLTKRVTCNRCKSELEYEPEDVKSTTYTDGDTISSIKHHVQCPLCLEKLGPNFCFVYVARPSGVRPITAENDPDSRVHCARCGEHVRAPLADHIFCTMCAEEVSAP